MENVTEITQKSPSQLRVKGIVNSLDRVFTPTEDIDPSENLKSLQILNTSTKFEIESLLSTIAITTLSDEDYIEIQRKVTQLIEANTI